MKAIRATAVILVLMLVALTGTACTGEQGESGVGIQGIVNNGNGTFTITLTDGSTFTSSDLRGLQGAQGPEGPQGPSGEMPIMEWHRLTTFTGVETQETTGFYVPMDDFRLIYFIESSLASNFFTVFVNPVDDTGMVGCFEREDITTIAAGVEYIRDGRGEYYLKVHASGLSEWTICVDALY